VAHPDLSDAEITEILDTLHSGWLTSGPKVQRLEAELGEYLRVPDVRCLSSCTAGLFLSLRLLDLEPGDEVLVPANTFVACANAVEHAGGRPVFVDVSPTTGLIDLDHAEALIGPRTRAIMPVHLGGRPVDLDALADLERRRGIAIIEDAAHAIGAEWRGIRVGAWGNPCSFSFHATKNMTTFEGGALVVADPRDAERVERLASHGLSRSAWSRHGSSAPARYDVVEPGFKLAMNDVAAAVGIHQLRRLDTAIAHRRRLAQLYDEALAGLPLQHLAPLEPGARHAHHLYIVLVEPDAPLSRDDLVVLLRRRQIGSSVHFHGIHLHTYYRERYALKPGMLPCATDWSRRALSLPLHTRMGEEDVAFVADALRECLTSSR
jgi:dTDP-4-amino-4,6-dideoxygalactose transaminase